MDKLPKLEELIQDVSQLVSLPEVFHRLEAAIEDKQASLDDIGGIIGRDTDLSARLLRIANSAFYGFPARIESIARALSTIGTRELRDLVLATVVVRLFSRLPLGKLSMSSFWRHSVFTGVLARVIARKIKEPNEERYYLAGLLHDIGRLVLFVKLPGLMHELLLQNTSENRLLYELERERLAYDHADVGAALLQLWRLPQSLYESVGCHHVPQQAQGFPLEAAVIHLANWAASVEHQGNSGDTLVPHLNPVARGMVSLDESALGDCIGTALLQFEDIAAVFTTY